MVFNFGIQFFFSSLSSSFRMLHVLFGGMKQKKNLYIYSRKEKGNELRREMKQNV
jgi:hypothetical protein